MQTARLQGRRGARPLRSPPPVADRGLCGGCGAGAAAPHAPERTCRICWGSEAEGLVAPCSCSGSMQYVHAGCLQQWQQQLRAQKGLAASRRCDVCQAAWATAHQLPAAPSDWRLRLRDLARSVPWPLILQAWKYGVLAVGAVRGMQAGMDGFRAGVQWAAPPPRRLLWAPQLGTHAGVTLPPLQAPMAVCLAAFVTGLAAQMALMSLVCTYAGSIVGFVSGVVGSLQATVQLGGVLVRVGGLGARALAGAAVRGAAAAGGLGAPVVMALLKTLALSRLFA